MKKPKLKIRFMTEAEVMEYLISTKKKEWERIQ